MSPWFICFTAIQLLVINVEHGCNSEAPALVQFGVVGGGVPPYSVVDTEDCVGQGEGFALCGGSKLMVMDSFNSTVEIEIPSSRDFLTVNVRFEKHDGADCVLASAEPQGGTPPYTYKWNDGSTGASLVALEYVDLNVVVEDSRKCSLSVSFMVSPPSPPPLDEKDCSRRMSECRKLPIRYAVDCLKKHMLPPCIAKAAIVLALRLISWEAADRDHGPSFLALQLVVPRVQREDRDMMMMLRQLLEYDSTLSALLELYATGDISSNELLNRSFEYILGGGDFAGPYDTLVISPQGFNNDPIFAPQMVHGGRKVACLVNAYSLFKSTFVRVLVFPPSLECDVDLAASYLRLVVEMLKPKWVFPGDSEGILLLGKLRPRGVYPPSSLSKLAPGHERFAPKEVIVSEEDGLKEISLDVAR